MNEITNTAAGIDDAELDNAWNSEDDGFDAAGEARILQADRPGGEQQPADQPAATQTDTDPAQKEDDATADQPELFTIRYRGQEEQLTRDQLTTLAQKGRDYDTVRTERDQLKAERQANAAAVDLVKGYAQRMGMEVPAYLDYCRKQELLRGGMDEKSAEQTIRMEKRKANLDAQEERRKDFGAFLKAYPGVDPKSIPKEVWQKVNEGTELTRAYTMHENRRLQAELAAERQNKANRQRTPGSLGGNMSAELDEIDRLWNEDD